MQFYQTAGPMALGSRLRRLSGALTDDAQRVYELYDVGLDPRWFPAFYVLAELGPHSVTELARAVGHSHAAISQVVAAMRERGLVATARGESDARVRQVALTATGAQLAERLTEQVGDVRATVEDLLGELDIDLWSALDQLEARLESSGLFARVQRRLRERSRAEIELSDYRRGDGRAFAQLNEEWIDAHFSLEEADHKLLRDPRRAILAKGGHIVMARHDGRAVGCCALLRFDDETFELAKMAVAPSHRGRGVGLLLGDAVIDKARRVGARRVYLESNTVLAPAIGLYRKLGFREVDAGESPYARCNIKMELLLD